MSDSVLKRVLSAAGELTGNWLLQATYDEHDELDRVAREVFNRSFNELSPMERDRVRLLANDQ